MAAALKGNGAVCLFLMMHLVPLITAIKQNRGVAQTVQDMPYPWETVYNAILSLFVCFSFLFFFFFFFLGNRYAASFGKYTKFIWDGNGLNSLTTTYLDSFLKA